MSVDPLKLTSAIKESYVRYLTTTFRLRDPQLQKEFRQQVEGFGFLNGPILEAIPPFKNGCFLTDLRKLGLINEECEAFFHDSLPYLKTNPLYLHQEQAIRKIANRRNIVIASGTGSGKTESFLLPIYNQLFDEYKSGRLTPGVRALLLYPMNALANDQLRRLQDMARVMDEKFPSLQITFGRYVGDTETKKEKALNKFRLANPGKEPAKNELLSREEMQENPPHILITNYAMLEYLLLRPRDSSFFDGKHAKHWKFLVLDEAHIYSGASGIEMGMLIRRLKDRVSGGKRGALQCIATSATLGNNEADFDKVAEFGQNLFDEEIEWNSQDDNRQDIIKGERAETKRQGNRFQPYLKLYPSLEEAIKTSSDPIQLMERSFKAFIEAGVPQQLVTEARDRSHEEPKRFVYEVLVHDSRIQKLKKILEPRDPGNVQSVEALGATKLEDCITNLIGNDNPSREEKQSILSLINTAVWARYDAQSLPVLPARYHLFVRAPEGIFASLYPREDQKIFLERREYTEKGFPVFDLASCRRCGQEYLVGDIIDGKLKHPFTGIDVPRKNRYFLLLGDGSLPEDDEDEEIAAPDEEAPRGLPWKLCVICGAIWQDVKTCNCIEEDTAVRTIVEVTPKEGDLNVCHLCGLRSRNIVREFVLQQDAPTAVLATVLYEYLKDRPQKQKKILAFSDSRQDAAFFAPYLDFTYQRFLHRRIIAEAVKRSSSVFDYRLQSLSDDILKLANENDLFDINLGYKEKKKEVWRWLIQEFCALDRRLCLEGVGLLSFSAVPPKGWKPLTSLSDLPWNLSETECIALYQTLINTLRFNKAITFPEDGPSPEDEAFARFNRNREYRLRGEKSDNKKAIYSFIPARGRLNARLEFLRKLYSKATKNDSNDVECRELLRNIWYDIKTNWKENLFEFSDRKGKEGVLTQFDYRYWRILHESPDTTWYACDRCGVVSPVSVRKVCPTFGCNGELRSTDASARREQFNQNHYLFLYTNLPLTKLIAEEHTAQLSSDEATSIQQKFINGEINVLSCSTTFELGVDLGELEIIFMRNVPPEPSNYIQRSGRAGRRLDSIGFTLTFAQVRSHDLTHFKAPENMVEGRIKPPVVEIRNDKIVRRHLHSIVLARFFRENPEYFGDVDSFFRLQQNGITGTQKVKEYLETKPEALIESLKRTIPRDLHVLFDIDNWVWTNGLVGKDLGALAKADEQVRDEFSRLFKFYQDKGEELKRLIDAGGDRARETQINRDRNWASDSMNRVKKRKLLDFLATYTVIPKYGFPVDVVELTPYSHVPEAKKIQLNRDLRIALSEFAPSSEVVAKGYLWKSAGLKVVKDRTWPIKVYAVCPNCQRFNIQDGTIEDRPPSFICDNCGQTISRSEIGKFITPVFGFVTDRLEEPKKVGESRPKKEFGTRPYFFHYDKPIEKDFRIGKLDGRCKYSANGELAVICKGKKGRGFWICFGCGKAKSDPFTKDHRSPFGEACSHPPHSNLHLGHTFKTDVLTISLKRFEHAQVTTGDRFWPSLLYAVLEGSSQALGIRRQDLDGCLYPHEGAKSLILFDNVPGGAGHVHRIMKEEQNLQAVLLNALARVKNCSCGPETSCYTCLRNFQNQFCHEKLQRGIVLDFLSKNLEEVVAQEN